MADRPHYDGWASVPDGLMTATQLGELEFPRQAPGRPHAWVTAYDWRDRKDTVALYRAAACPPTSASGAALRAAAARSTRPRQCADCGAWPQRPPTPVDGRPLCLACLRVARLRRAQDEQRQARATVATRIAARLAAPGAVVVQVDVTTPPPTPAGSPRRPIAARIRACDATTGRGVLDMLVSLVGPRARIRDPHAQPTQDATPTVHGALIGHPLIAWTAQELTTLREHLPHPDWPRSPRWAGDDTGATVVGRDCATWRGELDDHGRLTYPLPPGTPDRLLEHLRRITATAVSEDSPTVVTATPVGGAL